MKKLSLFFSLLITWCAFAQVTLKVTSIPANTPAGATIYVAGSFQNWDPGATAMTPDGFGNYVYTIPEGSGTVEYKFTRGSWTEVEGNADGNYLPNRSFNFTGSPQTLTLHIESWEDLGGSHSTAAPNVQILSNSFEIPQLNRTRRVWIYLPPDYETSTKKYPVLYFQDGQNVFDNATSFAGEWGVDETLNDLFAQGDFGAIAVAVDNGGDKRIDEMTLWSTSEGGGEGEAFIQFFAETLKPYIDSHYRTRPEPEYNALIGSSLGALISTYGAVKYPNTFGKVGSFSPAYWIVKSQLTDYIQNSGADLSKLRIYFVAGQNESSGMVPDLQDIKNTLQTKGLTPENTLVKIDQDGQHSEWYWNREFAAAYQWLFQNETLGISEKGKQDFKAAYHQGILHIEGIKKQENARIIDRSGRTVEHLKISNGSNRVRTALPAGTYILSISSASKKMQVQ